MVIIVLHTLIDLGKETIKKIVGDEKITEKSKIVLFTIDQLLHFLVIIALTASLSLEFNSVNQYFLNNILGGNGLTYANLKNILIILYISFSGACFVPLLLNIVYEKVSNYNTILDEILKADIEDEKAHVFINEISTGKWIGI